MAEMSDFHEERANVGDGTWEILEGPRPGRVVRASFMAKVADRFSFATGRPACSFMTATKYPSHFHASRFGKGGWRQSSQSRCAFRNGLVQNLEERRRQITSSLPTDGTFLRRFRQDSYRSFVNNFLESKYRIAMVSVPRKPKTVR